MYLQYAGIWEIEKDLQVTGSKSYENKYMKRPKVTNGKPGIYAELTVLVFHRIDLLAAESVF